mmetsp:Transcript_57682/g.182666  ORF Transcript_57682/g.182666 Transcript_57682/m.182666 type:complete len:275 (-) Transcript_57682:108-932(-)
MGAGHLLARELAVEVGGHVERVVEAGGEEELAVGAVPLGEGGVLAGAEPASGTGGLSGLGGLLRDTLAALLEGGGHLHVGGLAGGLGGHRHSLAEEGGGSDSLHGDGWRVVESGGWWRPRNSHSAKFSILLYSSVIGGSYRSCWNPMQWCSPQERIRAARKGGARSPGRQPGRRPRLAGAHHGVEPQVPQAHPHPHQRCGGVLPPLGHRLRQRPLPRLPARRHLCALPLRHPLHGARRRGGAGLPRGARTPRGDGHRHAQQRRASKMLNRRDAE